MREGMRRKTAGRVRLPLGAAGLPAQLPGIVGPEPDSSRVKVSGSEKAAAPSGCPARVGFRVCRPSGGFAMNTKYLLVPAVIALLVIGLVLFPRQPGVAQEKAHGQAVKWEYKVVAYPSRDAEKALNALGEDGWELCGTTSSVSGKINPIFKDSGGSGSISTEVALVLKRPKR